MPYAPGFKPDMAGRNLPPVAPFDKRGLTMSAQDLELPVTYFAIHAEPCAYKKESRNLLRWQLSCVHMPLDPRHRIKLLKFEVFNHRDPRSGKSMTHVSVWNESCVNWDNNVDGKHFWWHKDAVQTFYGGVPYFGDIIRFLERADNRYEKFVNAQNLEGTFEWVCNLLGLLEERQYVGGMSFVMQVPGAKPGVTEVIKQSALEDFTSSAQMWTSAMEYYIK